MSTMQRSIYHVWMRISDAQLAPCVCHRNIIIISVISTKIRSCSVISIKHILSLCADVGPASDEPAGMSRYHRCLVQRVNGDNKLHDMYCHERSKMRSCFGALFHDAVVWHDAEQHTTSASDCCNESLAHLR
jgi:hypothetical protein